MWNQKDHIILSPLTFVSGANSVLFANAKPVFVDVSKEDQNLCPFKVEKKILELKKRKKKIGAIIVTDYGGMPANWKMFKRLRNKYNIKIINDNCHAIGSRIDNDKAYALKYADFVIHSYHAVKNITTGEGGSILTNDTKIFKKIKTMREHGFIKQKNKYSPWNYDLIQYGFNSRISDINCALGSSQLNRISEIIKKRNKIAKLYDRSFKDNIFIEVPRRKKNYFSSYHLYPIKINFKKKKISSKKFFLILKNKYKINLQKHYIPTYKFRAFKRFVSRKDKFPITESYFQKAFSIPIYLDLKKNDIKYISEKIIKITK